jgi:putative nucleotidyltransferase with HDIG domain
MSRRNEILAALEEIELLSSPALSAIQVINNPDTDGETAARALELDPALTSNVLRFANSAYFGCSRGIHTVREAVVRLGMKTISRMLFMSEASQWARRPVRGYDLAPKMLWDHLISTAVATEILAKKVRLKAPNYAFTAALLHDIGKIVLGTYLEVDAEPILALAVHENIPFDEAEFRVLGINHAEAGAELLRHWNLPAGIVDAVRWHHAPNLYSGEKLTVDLIHVADVISMMAGTGLGVDGLNYAVCPESEKRLGINITIVEQVLCELQDEVSKLGQMCE